MLTDIQLNAVSTVERRFNPPIDAKL